MNKKAGDKTFLYFKLKSKKGEIVQMEVIMIVLTLAFFGSIWWFIAGTSTDIALYEQIYAKEIALLIDKAEPFMSLEIPFEEAIELAKENNGEINKIVFIDDDKNFVRISLTFDSQQNNQGYIESFLSDYKVVYYVNENEKSLILNIDRK